jgi:deoxyribose-phosphate aldolase
MPISVDYLNFRLTGVLATDHSYAAGSAAYDLLKCDYDQDYIKVFDLLPEKFPELVESHEILGTIKAEAAEELGLPKHLLVAAGGVDISCMATGAGCIEDGTAYTNLGTSAWVSVISHKPVINIKTKPYVFGCLSKGMYNSSESIFSAGNTHRWVRNTICPDLLEQEKTGGEDAYAVMEQLAIQSKPGANGLLFVPTMAGANALDKSLNAKGAILGLELRHTRGDIVQATLEGICMELRRALDELQRMVPLSSEMLIVGGGARSTFWRQLFADIYGLDIITSAVGENAGSLGAMACAAIGAGLWKDYTPLKALNKPVNRAVCNREVFPNTVELCKKILAGNPVHIYALIAYPHGTFASIQKADEIGEVLSLGAHGIEVCINCLNVRSEDWDAVQEEMRQCRKAAGDSILKYILEVEWLSDLQIIKCCKIALDEKVDCIVTSTGLYNTVDEDKNDIPIKVSEKDIRLIKNTAGSGIRIMAQGYIDSPEMADALVHAGADYLGIENTLPFVLGDANV